MPKKRKRIPKSVLKLPDLEQSKSAVLNSLPTVPAFELHVTQDGPEGVGYRHYQLI